MALPLIDEVGAGCSNSIRNASDRRRRSGAARKTHPIQRWSRNAWTCLPRWRCARFAIQAAVAFRASRGLAGTLA